MNFSEKKISTTPLLLDISHSWNNKPDIKKEEVDGYGDDKKRLFLWNAIA